MRQIVSDTTAPFHQLYLLFVDAENAAVRVGRSLVAYDKTVGKRGYLKIVAYAGHRSALRNDIAEMVEQIENRLLCKRIFVFVLDACQLFGQTHVHLFRRRLVYVAERVFQGVFAYPNGGGKFVAVEIFD